MQISFTGDSVIIWFKKDSLLPLQRRLKIHKKFQSLKQNFGIKYVFHEIKQLKGGIPNKFYIWVLCKRQEICMHIQLLGPVNLRKNL